MKHQVIFIMGVSGSGKTTIGKLLAQKTAFSFYDADDFHSQQNIEKMSAGVPLTDEDRWPWLDGIHSFAATAIQTKSIIIACSALRQVYRQRLANGFETQCRWVFLKGSYETILQRMKGRNEHYMPAILLQSQFDALEMPEEAIVADIRLQPERIVEKIITILAI
jgi:carbohydrate kinase (thermoresistant glucokinase family)